MTNRPGRRHTMRGIRTALTTAAAVALLAACGGGDEPPTDTEPEPTQSLPPAETGPLDGEQLRDTLGDEVGELCQFPASRTADIDRFGEPVAISSLQTYGEWEQAYAERYGGCIVLSWDETVDPEFLPAMHERLAERVGERQIVALTAEDERWVLTLDDGLSSTAGYDEMVEDGQRIAELLGRGEPVQPES